MSNLQFLPESSVNEHFIVGVPVSERMNTTTLVAEGGNKRAGGGKIISQELAKF